MTDVKLDIEQLYSFYRRPSEIKINGHQFILSFLKRITRVILEIEGSIWQRHRGTFFLHKKI